MQDDASGKILAAQFFPAETSEGYFCLLQSLLCRFGIPTAFYGDRSGIFVRNDDGWTLQEELAGQRHPTQFGRALADLGVTFIAAQSPQAKGRVERLWGVLQDRLCSELRLAQAADIDSANAVPRKFITDYNRRFACTPCEAAKAWRPAPDDLRRICASGTNASLVMTTSCSGTAAASRSRRKTGASTLREQQFSSTRRATARSRCTTAIPASSTPTPQGGDRFMLQLG